MGHKQSHPFEEEVANYTQTKIDEENNIMYFLCPSTGSRYLIRKWIFNDEWSFHNKEAEHQAHEKMNNEHLQKLLKYKTEINEDLCSKQYEVYALWEYYNQNLHTELQQRLGSNQGFTDRELWSIVSSCALGLSEMEKNYLYHQKLSSSTIFLSQLAVVKVSDPLSLASPPNCQKTTLSPENDCIYPSPEQCESLLRHISSPTSEKDDVWTMGMIMLECGLMHDQNSCYRDDYRWIDMSKVKDNLNKFAQQYGNSGLPILIEEMLKQNANDRPNWHEIYDMAQKIKGDRQRLQQQQKIQQPYLNNVMNKQPQVLTYKDHSKPYKLTATPKLNIPAPIINLGYNSNPQNQYSSTYKQPEFRQPPYQPFKYDKYEQEKVLLPPQPEFRQPPYQPFKYDKYEPEKVLPQFEIRPPPYQSYKFQPEKILPQPQIKQPSYKFQQQQISLPPVSQFSLKTPQVPIISSKLTDRLPIYTDRASQLPYQPYLPPEPQQFKIEKAPSISHSYSHFPPIPSRPVTHNSILKQPYQPSIGLTDYASKAPNSYLPMAKYTYSQNYTQNQPSLNFHEPQVVEPQKTTQSIYRMMEANQSEKVPEEKFSYLQPQSHISQPSYQFPLLLNNTTSNVLSENSSLQLPYIKGDQRSYQSFNYSASGNKSSKDLKSETFQNSNKFPFGSQGTVNANSLTFKGNNSNSSGVSNNDTANFNTNADSSTFKNPPILATADTIVSANNLQLEARSVFSGSNNNNGNNELSVKQSESFKESVEESVKESGKEIAKDWQKNQTSPSKKALATNNFAATYPSENIAHPSQNKGKSQLHSAPTPFTYTVNESNPANNFIHHSSPNNFNQNSIQNSPNPNNFTHNSTLNVPNPNSSAYNNAYNNANHQNIIHSEIQSFPKNYPRATYLSDGNAANSSHLSKPSNYNYSENNLGLDEKVPYHENSVVNVQTNYNKSSNVKTNNNQSNDNYNYFSGGEGQKKTTGYYKQNTEQFPPTKDTVSKYVSAASQTGYLFDNKVSNHSHPQSNLTSQFNSNKAAGSQMPSEVESSYVINTPPLTVVSEPFVTAQNQYMDHHYNNPLEVPPKAMIKNTKSITYEAELLNSILNEGMKQNEKQQREKLQKQNQIQEQQQGSESSCSNFFEEPAIKPVEDPFTLSQQLQYQLRQFGRKEAEKKQTQSKQSTKDSEKQKSGQKSKESKEKRKTRELPPVSDDEQLEYVIETFKEGSRYEGYKLNNMRHGHGRFYYQDGGMYDGNWRNNKMDGQGSLYYQNGSLAYEGEWRKDQFCGKGKLYNNNPVPLNQPFDYKDFDEVDEFWDYYDGEFEDDLKTGRGTMMISNGEYYVGGFYNDMIEGLGKYYTKNNGVIKGRWEANKFISNYESKVSK